MDPTKLNKLKMKRYFAKYEYLDMELAETEYLFALYQTQFMNECQISMPAPSAPPPEPPPEPPPAPPPAESAPISEPEPDAAAAEKSAEIDIECTTSIEHDESIKKIYKILCLKVHPDKGGDEKAFIDVKLAYNTNNIFKLMQIANSLDIDLNGLIDEKSVDMYEKTIADLETKISDFKKKVAWVWAFSDDEKKDEIRRTIAGRT